MSGETRKVVPYLPQAIMSKLCAYIRIKQEHGLPLGEALRSLDEKWRNEPWSLQLRTTALVLADLLDHGWKTATENDTLELTPPGLRTGSETVEDAKRRLRHALQIGQRRQLREPGVRKFLDRVTASRWRGGIMASVLDLVDDGSDLAGALRATREKPLEASLRALRSIIRPSIEVVSEDARCTTTGLRLMDIWRFFRHTWSLEYRPIPGRQMPVLIRNEARPNRPVIGIALLASPVLRTRPRDNWLRWTPEPFINALREGIWPIDDAMEALRVRLLDSISEIRCDDFANAQDFANPTENLVFKLERLATGAAVQRENALREVYLAAGGAVGSQKDRAHQSWSEEEWREASDDMLYIRKRAETLARLIKAIMIFKALSKGCRGEDLLAKFREKQSGKLAVSIALQEVRKAGLSSRIADLSVCGAVPPYNALLGGKLVALLAASREVHDAWQVKYGSQVSIISSQMAGRPICRPADLIVLTTSSLYGSGSSQYNRLMLRPSVYYGMAVGLEWMRLEETTAGYGTVHLSPDTVQKLREFSETTYGARRINNRFGEGASPRLRQIREGLDALGIESDGILNHATPRLFYACPLSDEPGEQLVGLGKGKNSKLAAADWIANAWRRRWLHSRIQSDGVLDQVASRNGQTLFTELLPADEREGVETVA